MFTLVACWRTRADRSAKMPQSTRRTRQSGKWRGGGKMGRGRRGYRRHKNNNSGRDVCSDKTDRHPPSLHRQTERPQRYYEYFRRVIKKSPSIKKTRRASAAEQSIASGLFHVASDYITYKYSLLLLLTTAIHRTTLHTFINTTHQLSSTNSILFSTYHTFIPPPPISPILTLSTPHFWTVPLVWELVPIVQYQ